MASLRMAIIAAAEAALNAASISAIRALESDETDTQKPLGLTVHRQRKRALGQDKLPAIVLWCGREPTKVYDASSKVQRTLSLVVECRVAHPGQSGDEALDPLQVWASKVLMADITLGDTCEDVNEQETSWVVADESDDLAAAAIVFEIKYQTKNNDPERV